MLLPYETVIHSSGEPSPLRSVKYAFHKGIHSNASAAVPFLYTVMLPFKPFHVNTVSKKAKTIMLSLYTYSGRM